MVRLTETEKRFIDYATSFLLSNWEEDDEENLGLTEDQAEKIVDSVQQFLRKECEDEKEEQA